MKKTMLILSLALSLMPVVAFAQIEKAPSACVKKAGDYLAWINKSLIQEKKDRMIKKVPLVLGSIEKDTSYTRDALAAKLNAERAAIKTLILEKGFADSMILKKVFLVAEKKFNFEEGSVCPGFKYQASSSIDQYPEIVVIPSPDSKSIESENVPLFGSPSGAPNSPSSKATQPATN
jgi:hypothetical protein